MRYLIIGSGVAGVTAAKTIREYDADAEIRMYADEYHPLGLYARKDLARGLSTGLNKPEDFLIESVDDLERQGITFIQQSIPCIYPKTNQIFVNHAFRANYDRLLIATGATPMLVNAPGHHLLGVHQLRTYDDASLIEDWLPDLQRSGAVIVGGGILGMDMAYALTQRGVPVTLIAREASLGTPLMSEPEARHIEQRLTAIGVKLILGRKIDRFYSEDGRLLDAVMLDDGQRINTRMALCCIGVRPTTDFLADSGIDIDDVTGAIIVNAYMQTSIANIYAAGTCALTPSLLARNWATAAEQGRIAALNMLGERVQYHVDMFGSLEPLVMEVVLS